ncbi:MAG: hypothetical protein ACJARD_000697 [Alphaproteobacteria bacterium]|jgi:hypothetical protein
MKKTLLSTISALLLTVTLSSAQTFGIQDNNFQLVYDTGSNFVSSSFVLRDNSDSWGMVVTNGNIPNSGVQLIGDVDNNIISAYSYTNGNGEPLASNVFSENFLGSFTGAISNNGQQYEVDLSGVNQLAINNGGTPFAIDENAGVWFKGGFDTEFTYDNTGAITDYAIGSIYNVSDFRGQPTTEVIIPTPPSTPASEPVGLFVMLSALGLFFGIRKKS